MTTKGDIPYDLFHTVKPPGFSSLFTLVGRRTGSETDCYNVYASQPQLPVTLISPAYKADVEQQYYDCTIRADVKQRILMHHEEQSFGY